MDLEALGRSPIGELVPIVGVDRGREWRYSAYVPHPLPVLPTIGLAALNLSTQAAMEVARLDQAMMQLPNPQILVRPIVRREAVSTSALEGTYATFDEVLEADFLEEDKLSSEQREVRNYIIATEEAVQMMETYPISVTLLKRVQAAIVRGTRGATFGSGEIRTHQVCIGPPGRPIEESRFVPPPPGSVLIETFSDWEKWVNGAENNVPIVARMALTHYQFETMHPFGDGNGRLGRLVAVLQLIQEGALHHPVLNISPWLERRRQEYMDGLLNVSVTGDFDPWVEFFSEAVRTQAKEGVEKVNRLVSWRTEVLAALRTDGLRGSSLEIVEHLIGYPVINVPTARSIIGKSFEAANQAVSKLVQRGILREITGKRQDRLFVCDEVFRIITAE
ncbi:Fic/DOC family N-terminal domain-containing protein [Streptomyces hirsutus]|uniref:Fic family protein n=1 Tax=Streptomyces hirsutus TaxID=35620 RepID=UPI003400CC54